MTFRALSLYREKLENSTRVEEFYQLMNLYYRANYVLGKENLTNTDCSGLICGTLTLMGNKLRINANDIYQVLSLPDNEIYDPLKIKLVFFKDTSGKVKHIGVLCINDIIYHASYPRGAVHEPLTQCFKRYASKGLTHEIRMLSFDKVDENTGLIYDLDEELV